MFQIIFKKINFINSFNIALLMKMFFFSHKTLIVIFKYWRCLGKESTQFKSVIQRKNRNVNKNRYYFIIPAQAIKSPIMMHTFTVTLYFHIEFQRMTVVINLTAKLYCCNLRGSLAESQWRVRLMTKNLFTGEISQSNKHLP